MELYFKDNIPKLVYNTKQYARIRPNAVHYTDAGDYYVCDAMNYKEAIEHLYLRSTQYKNGILTEDFKNAILRATGTFIDHTRGDGFALLILPFDEWYEHLNINHIPPGYI